MVSISSAQPRFWLGLATDGAVGSSQFRGGRGFSPLRHFFPSMKQVAWAMQGASPLRHYIFSPSVSMWAFLVAWLWQPVLAREVSSLCMAQPGGLLAGLSPQHDSCKVCGSGPYGKISLASAVVGQAFADCVGTNRLDGWCCACYVDDVLGESACPGRCSHFLNYACTEPLTVVYSSTLWPTLPYTWLILTIYSAGSSAAWVYRSCVLGRQPSFPVPPWAVATTPGVTATTTVVATTTIVVTRSLSNLPLAKTLCHSSSLASPSQSLVRDPCPVPLQSPPPPSVKRKNRMQGVLCPEVIPATKISFAVDTTPPKPKAACVEMFWKVVRGMD